MLAAIDQCFVAAKEWLMEIAGLVLISSVVMYMFEQIADLKR